MNTGEKTVFQNGSETVEKYVIIETPGHFMFYFFNSHVFRCRASGDERTARHLETGRKVALKHTQCSVSYTNDIDKLSAVFCDR